MLDVSAISASVNAPTPAESCRRSQRGVAWLTNCLRRSAASARDEVLTRCRSSDS
jgi:hypothetical protein